MSSRVNKADMAAWRAFLEAHAHVSRVLEAELMAEKGLPLAWYDVLVQLHEAGGSLRMSDLADRLLLSRSATTRFAERLEAAGLVTRHVAASDRRGRTVELTDAGRERLRDAASVHLRGIAEHFASHLDDEEAAVVHRVLRRVAAGGGTAEPGR